MNLNNKYYQALMWRTEIFNSASKQPSMTLQPPTNPILVEIEPVQTKNEKNKPMQTNTRDQDNNELNIILMDDNTDKDLVNTRADYQLIIPTQDEKTHHT